MSRLIDPLLNLAQTACDKLFELNHYPECTHPQPRLIAHRGAWGNLPENSMAAFAAAQRLGAWGIEFDVRFTRDDAGVISHDPDLARCHGRAEKVCDVHARDLPAELCHLDEVLALKDLHFMIEIKEKLDGNRRNVLERALRHLTPIKDYHLLALSPDLVRISDTLPAEAWILVGELNSGSMVQESLRRKLGGVAGHYLLVSRKQIEVLRQANQISGTGFVPTKNIHRREWNRKVDWIFTNHLAALI